MQTPFVTLLTPLTAIPILLGLFIGAWGCLTIIANAHGLDLAAAVQWIHIDWRGGVSAPLILLGSAVFAIARGRLVRWHKAWEYVSLAAVALALATMSYWLELPLPWLPAILAVVLTWFGWRWIRRHQTA